MTVTWRDAVHADRRALQQFKCTSTPIKRAPRHVPEHPAIWEYHAQALVRDLRPPAKPGHDVVLGIDENTGHLAAVASGRVLDTTASVLVYEAELIAVQLEYRGRGLKLGRAAGQQLLDRAVANAAALERDEVLVECVVHDRNEPSQRLCLDNGITRDHTLSGNPESSQWSYLVPIDLEDPEP